MNNNNVNMGHYKIIKEFKKEYLTLKETFLEDIKGDDIKVFEDIEKIFQTIDIISLRFLLRDLEDIYDVLDFDNDIVSEKRNNHRNNVAIINHYIDYIDKVFEVG